MKKYLSFLAVLSLSVSVMAQTNNKNEFKSGFKAPDVFTEETASSSTPQAIQRSVRVPGPSDLKGAAFVNPIEIGQAGNAWGFAYHRTASIWVDNDINSISFIHRMLSDPGTGYLAYDVSTDGGMTWSVNNQVYDPDLPDAANGRYPQSVLYNPEGNTDPEEAYFHYFAPTLDGSNTAGANNWGGYAWGTKKFSEGSLPTQHNQSSTNEFRQYLPSGFTLTQLGETWVVDEENDGSSGSYEYTNNLIVGHGTWREDTQEFDYEFDHLELEISPDDGINDTKIAFAPDGMTGYICTMTQLTELLPYTTYHPVLHKTTDGGESWSDPIEVPLGGEDGLETVKNFITDEMLAYHFDPDPVPPRDEIDYFMGYHIDMSVDAWGNPHIIGLIAIADQEAGTWWNYEGVFAMFHVWSNDQGMTWEAFKLDDLVTFDTEWTGGSGSTLSMDNKPQVSTSSDGTIVFFSWLDTRLEGIEDNSQPDIYFREYLPSLDEHGEEVVNVTEFSAAMWQAYEATMPHYAFTEVNDANYECTIPWIYEELTSLDVSEPVQFHYIPDFSRSYTLVDILEPETSPIVSFAQNQPNPFRGETHMNLNLVKGSDVKISVYNITGQLVKQIDYGYLPNGPHRLTMALEKLTSGIYFYTVNAGNSKYTGKMIAQ